MRGYKRATHVTLVVEAKVNVMADLYINGESTIAIQEQGKMKTVTVDRSVYKLSKQATEAFNPILSHLVPGILLVHYYFIEISHTIYMGMKN